MKRNTCGGDGVSRGMGAGIKILELVMAWLRPQELANLACVSHLMATAVRNITHHRVADAAQGLERWPVPVRNDLDSLRYPWFQYTPSCCRNASRYAHPWGGEYASCTEPGSVMRRCQEDLGIYSFSGLLSSVGCRCADRCILAQQNQRYGEYGTSEDMNSMCTCGFISDGMNAYTHEFKLQLLCKTSHGADASKHQIDSKFIFFSEDSFKVNDASESMTCRTDGESFEFFDDDDDANEEPPLILECGGACICSADCSHRVTQQGLSVRVVVIRQHSTGWGLHAAQHISQGSFICEYAGELLTTVQSRERQSLYDAGNITCGSALLVVREYMPSGEACVRINVDATKAGNVARFINHACDGGNLLPCLVRASGSVIPRLALFARRDIQSGEELRYSYGSCGGVAGKVLPCYCGTPACFGTLPSEST